MKKYMVGTVADVLPGDEVIGSDGEWHKVLEVYDAFMPKIMLRVHIGNGWCECTGDHQWKVWLVADDQNVHLGDMTAVTIHDLLGQVDGELRIGKPDGPAIIKMERIEPKMSKCILVDSEDHQFEILLNHGDADEHL